MKEKIKFMCLNIFYIVIIWLTITNFIQAYYCPNMTQTELFLHLPKSFVCNWEKCI